MPSENYSVLVYTPRAPPEGSLLKRPTDYFLVENGDKYRMKKLRDEFARAKSVEEWHKILEKHVNGTKILQHFNGYYHSKDTYGRTPEETWWPHVKHVLYLDNNVETSSDAFTISQIYDVVQDKEKSSYANERGTVKCEPYLYSYWSDVQKRAEDKSKKRQRTSQVTVNGYSF